MLGLDLKTLLASYPDGAVIVLDRELKHVFAGGGLLEPGRPAGHDVSGLSVHEALSPALAEAVEPRLRAALSGEPQRLEVAVSGRIHELRATPIGSNGHVEGVLVIAVDVTPRAVERSRQAALTRIAEAALSEDELPQVLQKIHVVLRELMPAENLYIALQQPETRRLEFPYFADLHDPPPAPRPIGRGVTDYVLRTGRALLADPQTFARLVSEGEIVARGAPAVDWIGVPLRLAGDGEKECLGVLAVQSYDPAVRYGPPELELLQFVSTQVALAVDRKRAESKLRASAENMRKWILVLQERNRQIELLREMVTTLQGGRSLAEVFEAGGRFAKRLFPHEAGALLSAAGPSGELVPVVTWGEVPDVTLPVRLDACRALQEGRPHLSDDSHDVAACTHRLTPGGTRTLCLPLTSQGELLGVLSLTSRGAEDAPGGSLSEGTQRLAVAAADGIAMAAANLALRERLREQATRDPLTGLYNRRYLEESLRRELARAARRSATVGLLLVDLDGFKAFNDTRGHAAGDRLLTAFGACLGALVRAEDVACRYGGDEFLVVLPGVPPGELLARADQIRAAVKALPALAEAGLTASIGASLYPLHGTDVDPLVRAADEALYRAKAEGRDRARVAPG